MQGRLYRATQSWSHNSISRITTAAALCVLRFCVLRRLFSWPFTAENRLQVRPPMSSNSQQPAASSQQPAASSQQPAARAAATTPFTRTRTHARTHARTHTRTHACTHVRTYARTHTQTHTHTHTHTHKHTHKHTQKPQKHTCLGSIIYYSV